MKKEEHNESADGMEVDGVRLTSHEVQEMRRNGFDPTQYSAGILREVKAACADGKMIEDHDGGSLLDKLKLTADEKNKKEPEHNQDDDVGEECDEHHERHSHKWRKACGSRQKHTQNHYTEKLAEERKASRWNHCHAAS